MPRYLVLARREYAESLAVQGALDGDGGQDLSAVARARFGDGWLEMVLAPEHAVHWVRQPDAGAEVTA